MKHASTPEPLETRIALNGSAIAKALGVPVGGSVIDYSQAAAIAVGSNFGFDGLIGFPTGNDDQFVILSTGDATKFNNPGYPSHGTDWTSKGPPGDDVTMDLTLPVPVGAKRLKLDFVFLTQEHYDGYILGFVNEYEDFFKITANAGLGGGDETIVDYNVDNILYSPGAETGPNFLTRSFLLTMNYQVPAGATNISLHVALGDDLDGTGDTAVIMDNLRFEQGSQVVFLDFDGATTRLLGPGTSMSLPAFNPANFNSAKDVPTIASTIAAGLEARYAGYDISFVTSEPSGSFARIIIGGGNNATVTLDSTSDPILRAAYGTTPTFRTFDRIGAGTFGFGRAQALDIGNKDLNDEAVVFTQEFASSSPTATDTQLIDAAIGVIAHEMGHNLGLRHIEKSVKSNIMSQLSPRDFTASFEDIERPLAEGGWADGATKLNTADYLRTTLGETAGSGIGLGFSPISFTKYIFALFGSPVYNAFLAVIPGQPADRGGAIVDPDPGSSEPDQEGAPVYLHFDELSGKEAISLPVLSTGAKFAFYAQSTPGGAFDIFSGTPDANGDISPGAREIPLFDANGNLTLTIPMAMGAPGSLVAAPPLALEQNAFRFPLLPFGTYEDTPPVGAASGDSYTIKLTSKTGTGGFTILDPDGDGKGPIDQIFLQDTTIKDKLSISVKKPTKDQLEAGLDGLVDIGSIQASTLASIDAKSSNLVGSGIDVGNLLGALNIRDVLNGADIVIGGGEFVKTKITARVIADGTNIVSRATIDKLTAVRIGDGTIDAPGIGKLKVTGDKKAAIGGDFRSDVTLAHSSPFLTAAILKKTLLGSVSIAGVTEGVNFDIGGNVGSFKTARFVDSTLNLTGFVFDPKDPTHNHIKLGSFTASGIKGLADAAFDSSSIIAAIIGKATLASVDTDNMGIAFGISAATKISGVSAKVLLPGTNSFNYDTKGAAIQSSGDFTVQLV